MDRISIREFARREGLSDTLVRRAIKRGRLKTLADGQLDAALVGAPWCERNARKSPTPPPANTANKTVRMVLDREELPFDQALALKENWLAAKHETDTRAKAGQLISLEIARTVLFEAARGARDSWLNWPAKVGPMIAAELNLPAEQVVEILTRYVHQQLADLGEPDGEFV